jgi:glutamyl endopeptidase
VKNNFLKSILALSVVSLNCFSSVNSVSATTPLRLKSTNTIDFGSKNINNKINLNAKNSLIASVYGQDDRVVVSDTTQAPWSNIAGLKMKFPNGKEFVGSGAAIDSTHIITAAHNVFLKNNGGLADVNSIDVRFEKYGNFKVTKVRILEGWTKEDNWKLTNNQWKPIDHTNDLALLTLDRPLENFTPYFQLETAAPSSLSSLTVNVSGYPDSEGIAWQKLQMKTASGSIDSISNDNYQLFYNNTLDTQGGQSGSPLWYLDGQTNAYKIVGVHVAGDEWVNGNFYNSATHINNDKLQLVLNWIQEDTQSASTSDSPDYL